MNLPDLLKKIVVYSLFVYGIYNLSTFFIDIYSLSQKEAEKNHKIETLESEKKNLKEKLVYINSDDFVEKEARTKLNMKKDGEQVYIVNNGSNPDESEEKDIKRKTKKTVFNKWMEVIF